jgi:hypothetical protein
MKPSAFRLLACILLALSFSSASLAKKQKPAPDPRFEAIDQIVVLPVVDARAGKKDSVNFDSLRKVAINDLKHKNYRLTASDDTGTVGQIAEEDLNEGSAAWIKRLGPSDARYVLVIGLDDVHSKFTFGSTGNAELVGFLFDKQDGSTLWKGNGVGQAGQGGLYGMAFKGMMKGAALETAMNNLFAAIPKLSKKGR